MHCHPEVVNKEQEGRAVAGERYYWEQLLRKRHQREAKGRDGEDGKREVGACHDWTLYS